MTSTFLARAFWIALLSLCVWESGKSLMLTRSRVDPADVKAMRNILQHVESPVLAHRAWLEPSLRSWFPRATNPKAFAGPAPQELAQFWSIGHRSDPKPLAFASDAQLEQTVTHGALVARRWVQPKAPTTLADLTQNITDIQAHVQQGICKKISRSPLKLRCPDQSSLTWEISEIDYKARSCLSYRPSQLGPLTLSFKLATDQPPQRVVGHVGFSDFNARLRSDAALQVSLRVDKHELVHQPFSDAQGWAPFFAPLPHSVQPSATYHLSLQLNANRAKSEHLSRRVIPCIELRFQNSSVSP